MSVLSGKSKKAGLAENIVLDSRLKLAGGGWIPFSTARHANGSWVSLEVVAYNLLDHPVIQGVLISGRDISDRKRDEAVKDQLIWELQQTLARLNDLSGVLPICASCKKIQNEVGNWEQIELYIRERTQVESSRGMCPGCARLWFPGTSRGMTDSREP